MGKDIILVKHYDFLTLAKRVGFPYVNLPRLLQYSMTASGLDMNFSRRVTYDGIEPFRILFCGPLALPISPVIGVSRKSAIDPIKGFQHAYELSRGGMIFNYLPPIDDNELGENGVLAQGYYTIWLSNNYHELEGK